MTNNIVFYGILIAAVASVFGLYSVVMNYGEFLLFILLTVGTVFMVYAVPTFHRKYKDWREDREFNKETRKR